MSNGKAFQRISPEQEAEYARLARLEHGPDLVRESTEKWNSYSEAKKDRIMAEGNAIYADIATMMQADIPATDSEVQELFERWKEHLRYFYEPSLDLLRGLGDMYAMSPDFRKTFENIADGLPEYMQEGIEYYVDELETAVLSYMLEQEDEARVRRLGE